MHELWKIPTGAMTSIRLQNYTNMLVGKHAKQLFKDVIVVLLLILLYMIFLVPTNAHPL